MLVGDETDRVKKVRGGFLFEGCGWGHGVGMCQYGSQGLAKRGYAYHDILRRYYGGEIELRALEYANEAPRAADDEADRGASDSD